MEHMLEAYNSTLLDVLNLHAPKISNIPFTTIKDYTGTSMTLVNKLDKEDMMIVPQELIMKIWEKSLLLISIIK